MENLDLFTPVEKFKAAPKTGYYCIAKSLVTNNSYKGYYSTNPIGLFYVDHYDEHPTEEVTHVLDLSKLTTKDVAREAVREVFENRDIGLTFLKFDL